MKQEAIEKLKKEIADNPNNPYVSYIGTTLIGHLDISEDFAEHVLKENKSVKGSLTAMEEAARKVKTGSMAMLTPDQGFTIIFNYYMDNDADLAEPEETADVKEEIATDESNEETTTSEVETFSRNAWLEDPETGKILAFKIGDEKPVNIKNLKRSTKKEYEAYIAIQKEATEIAEEYDDDLGDLW